MHSNQFRVFVKKLNSNPSFYWKVTRKSSFYLRPFCMKFHPPFFFSFDILNKRNFLLSKHILDKKQFSRNQKSVSHHVFFSFTNYQYRMHAFYLRERLQTISLRERYRTLKSLEKPKFWIKRWKENDYFVNQAHFFLLHYMRW